MRGDGGGALFVGADGNPPVGRLPSSPTKQNVPPKFVGDAVPGVPHIEAHTPAS
ncbi:MAG: hypothetical protein FWE47_02305 [Oscillospiraceae bacterium]|nr:hypothetical protein [Oscillospiraceae bacterium]